MYRLQVKGLTKTSNVKGVNNKIFVVQSSLGPSRRFFAQNRKAVIGVDEAGLGPLLGPLAVIRVSVAAEDDKAVAKALTDANAGVHDSKKVHIVGDLAPIEAAALGTIYWMTGGKVPKTAADLFALMGEKPEDRTLPWQTGADTLNLPLTIPSVPQWNIKGIEPISFGGHIVHPVSLNEARKNGINKAELELQYIGKLLEKLPDGFDSFEIFIDRLGGRKYYAEHLQKIWNNSDVTIQEETQNLSSYDIVSGDKKIHTQFVVSGEEKSPIIALASCLAKYTRELHMNLLNKYWCEKFPRTKPTDGYHRDGKRWINSISKQDRGIIPPLQDVLIRAGQELDIKMSLMRSRAAAEQQQQTTEQKSTSSM